METIKNNEQPEDALASNDTKMTDETRLEPNDTKNDSRPSTAVNHEPNHQTTSPYSTQPPQGMYSPNYYYSPQMYPTQTYYPPHMYYPYYSTPAAQLPYYPYYRYYPPQTTATTTPPPPTTTKTTTTPSRRGRNQKASPKRHATTYNNYYNYYYNNNDYYHKLQQQNSSHSPDPNKDVPNEDHPIVPYEGLDFDSPEDLLLEQKVKKMKRTRGPYPLMKSTNTRVVVEM